MLRTAAVLIPFLSACCWLHAAASPEEAQKQAEFKKAYAVPDKGERQKALQLLSNLADTSTLAVLASVCTGDPEKDVRAEAFQVLSKAPVRTGALAQMLTGIVLQTRDADQKLALARDLANSEFKYPIGAALADLCSRLRYPDLIKVTANAKFMSDPNAHVNKQRDEFAGYFNVFKSVTKADLPGPDKNSPQDVKRWWEAHSGKILAADNDLAKKYKAEDQAKAAAAKASAEPKKPEEK